MILVQETWAALLGHAFWVIKGIIFLGMCVL